MATGENVLFVLERTKTADMNVTARHVYRTREEAREAQRAKQARENGRSSGYHWYLRRATWGSDS